MTDGSSAARRDAGHDALRAEPDAPSPAACAIADDAPLEGRRSDLLRAVWGLAWPVILTMSLESIVGLIDMLMVGRLGASAVAAVGVGVQVLSAVSTTMFAVGTGALAVVARYVGAGEMRDAEDALMQSVLAAAGLSLAAMMPVLVWAPALMHLFGVADSVVAVGTPYIRLVMLGLPADAVLFTIAMGLRGAGDTRTPLLFSAVTGITKLLANYAFIFGGFGFPALGVPGAACSTALAFTMGAGVAITLLARGGLALRIVWRRMRVELVMMRRVLRIGYPAALEQFLMQMGFFTYIVFAAKYGTSAVAAYFIGVRILALSFLPGFGFAAAAGALVGQNLGAGQPRQAERSGWESTRLAIYLMSAAGICIFLFAEPIARLFVADPEVVADAVSFIHCLAAAQPLMGTDFTLGGALRGAGDTRFPLVAVFVAFYGCRLGFAYLATFWLHLSIFWVWFALMPDYLARSLLKGYRFRSGRWKTIAV
jgi:putative MATE family efflux protein